MDFLDDHLIPPTQIGVFTAAIGAYFAVFDGGVLFGAVFAIGDGGNGFNLKSAAAKKVGAIGVPIPTIDQLIVDDGGHFTDLHNDFLDFVCFVLFCYVADKVCDVEHHSQLVHDYCSLFVFLFGCFCGFDRFFVFLL